jgi:hypothetical protein
MAGPRTVLLLLPLALTAARIHTAAAQDLNVTVAVTKDGRAAGRWLAMIRPRLTEAELRAIGPLRKPLSPAERAWADLIRSRETVWEGEIPVLAADFEPVAPPARVEIVLGNRGGPDAFVSDPVIGFDLGALQAAYGAAALPENAERIDRLFRHEYVHLLQKAWLRERPYATDSPLRAALAEIWAEGMGNYRSLSARWRADDGRPSAAAAEARAVLEPRLVARISALACAPPQRAAELTADLSTGRFDEKWGALPAALWLEAETARSRRALRDFVLAGPDGVWGLAARHLAEPLRTALEEARAAASLCAAPPATAAGAASK